MPDFIKGVNLQWSEDVDQNTSLFCACFELELKTNMQSQHQEDKSFKFDSSLGWNDSTTGKFTGDPAWNNSAIAKLHTISVSPE